MWLSNRRRCGGIDEGIAHNGSIDRRDDGRDSSIDTGTVLNASADDNDCDCDIDDSPECNEKYDSGDSSRNSRNSSSGHHGSQDKGLEPQARCSQCGRRRTACHHFPHHPHQHGRQAAPTSANTTANANAAAAPLHAQPRRISELRHRAALTANVAHQYSYPHPHPHQHQHQHQHPTNAAAPAVSFSQHPPPSGPATTTGTTSRKRRSSTSPEPASDSRDSSDSTGSGAAMDPPVLSFYGKEPVPLPSRFGQIKRNLVAGHEAELEASWARLITALREHRYGLGVVRGVVPRADAQVSIDETVKYLEKQTEFKQPPPQDPTCFDFFWTPAQVRTRAHPRLLEAQRFLMSLWDNNADDRMAIRFPIAYGDRLRIHGADIGNVGPDAAAAAAAKEEGSKADDDQEAGGSLPDADLDDGLEAQRAAAELLGDFTSSTVIAQVDNGSLERWEPDGYGRGGTYEAVFKGEWEKYDPWDPTHRVTATPDLYNGYGACSIFRMYQGMVALSTIEPGLIRLLPSPKLATAYFLLRPFFSPKTKPPERREGPEWDAFLDPSNWALDKEQSTIIHGAVPGHAQRLTELWHPHLHLRRTLQTIPTLQTGDYIVWHPDLAYHITSNPNVMASRAPTPPPPAAAAVAGDQSEGRSGRPVSILVYVPAAPLTQTNALYLARQRKTFQRGHPGPDFDSTGSGLGSEANHVGRPTEADILEVGGPAALQAMGLEPFDVAPTPPQSAGSLSSSPPSASAATSAPAGENTGAKEGGQDVDMTDAGSGPGLAVGASASGTSSMTRAEAEVARMANIILFPDRYDFYMAKRNSSGTKRSKVRVEKLLNPVDPPSPPKTSKDRETTTTIATATTRTTITATTTTTITTTTSSSSSSPSSTTTTATPAAPAADGKKSS
ncbi:hypothetical protein VTH06DRAFT_6276 [Thermothelomyces fergusii]